MTFKCTCKCTFSGYICCFAGIKCMRSFQQNGNNKSEAISQSETRIQFWKKYYCIFAVFIPPKPYDYVCKRIVHPKMLFHVIPNLYEFLSSAEHKRWYFEECRQPNSFWSLKIDLFVQLMEVNRIQHTFPKCSIYRLLKQMTEMHTGLEQLEGE